MLYDMSGTEYAYPSGNPRLSSFTAWGPIWRNALSPPHPTDSRWAALERVINDFFVEISDCNPAPYTSLVTWGSDYKAPLAPFAQFTSSTLDVALPPASNPIAQRDLIKAAIQGLGNKQMFGSTNLSAGLDRARLHLTSDQARSFTAKVIILFTDGLWNVGRDPLLAAQDARDAGIIVHTVSMLTPYQPTLAQIAETTGGRNFTTFNEVQLRDAFREIAEGLQVVLVE
jgi:Ca-activated chloride channel homolog